MLIDRNYNHGIIDAAITRAKSIPRSEALKKVVKSKSSKRPVFVVRFDRRLPSVTQITRKHWRTMVQDPYLAEPSLKVYTRPQTIRDKIRAKVPPAKSNSRRVIPGMHKCGSNCEICPFAKTQKLVKATYTNEVFHLPKHYDCKPKTLLSSSPYLSISKSFFISKR